MNTRGISVLIWIFILVGFFFLASMPIFISTSFAKGEIVQKIDTAHDLALMVNTLIAVPGDAIVEYPRKVKDYRFALNSESILVFSPGDNELQRVRRTFHVPEDYHVDGFVENEERICFNKVDKRMTLEGCK